MKKFYHDIFTHIWHFDLFSFSHSYLPSSSGLVPISTFMICFLPFPSDIFSFLILHILLSCSTFKSIPCNGENIQYLYLWVLFIILNIMVSSNINFLVQVIILFFFTTEQNSTTYVYHIFFIYVSIESLLGWFPAFAIMNSVEINIGVQVIVLGMWPSMIQLYHMVNLFFSFWRQTDFYSIYWLTSLPPVTKGLFPHILASICFCLFPW